MEHEFSEIRQIHTLESQHQHDLASFLVTLFTVGTNVTNAEQYYNTTYQWHRRCGCIRCWWQVHTYI